MSEGFSFCPQVICCECGSILRQTRGPDGKTLQAEHIADECSRSGKKFLIPLQQVPVYYEIR